MKLVLIEWIDAAAHDEWTAREDVAMGVIGCSTVGFLISNDDFGVTVAGTVGDEGGVCEQYRGMISIPHQSITHLKEL